MAEPIFVYPNFPGLNKLEEEISTCVKCALSKTRIRTVFGDGNPKSLMMIIGEG